MPHTVLSYIDDGNIGTLRGHAPPERVVYAGDDLSISIRLKIISSVIPAPHNSVVTFKLMEEQFGAPVLIKTWRDGIVLIAGSPGFAESE